jgi:hypothetical protein
VRRRAVGQQAVAAWQKLSQGASCDALSQPFGCLTDRLPSQHDADHGGDCGYATIISALKKRSRVLVLTAGARDGVLYERC